MTLQQHFVEMKKTPDLDVVAQDLDDGLLAL